MTADIDALVAQVNQAVAAASSVLPFDHPIKAVRWVRREQVEANDYNPNSVATPELRLLAESIRADGYTQPVVVVEAGEDRYTVVDGFHRWLILSKAEDVAASTQGFLPVVVIQGDEAHRMASTVRHNRARGKHHVGGMSELVYRMLAAGVDEGDVCEALGLEPIELLRLKHVSGFSKLVEDHEYRRSWETVTQRKIKGQWAADHPEHEGDLV